MKRMFIRMFILLISGIFLFSGCAAFQAAPLMMSAAVALSAADFNKAMKSVDMKGTVEADIDKVWEWSVAAMDDMGVQILDKNLDEEKKGGIITGKTERHQKIQIILVADTSMITSIGIKARVREFMNIAMRKTDIDSTFAQVLSNRIFESYYNYKNTKSSSM